MVGGAGEVTVIVNGASEAVPDRSLTEIVIPEYEPTLAELGVPDSSPVVVLNVDQAGWFTIENVCSFHWLDTVGANAYAFPACTEVTGVPLIFGENLSDASAGPGTLSVVNRAATRSAASASRGPREDTWTGQPRGDNVFN
jgi:hypothetical protein